MARWKILVGHYLNTIPQTEWEYIETSNKGEQIRMRVPVPRLIDPKDPKCWTNRWGPQNDQDGECILAMPGRGAKGDIEFRGDPTPDMIPIDDEAREISAQFEDRWKFKQDGEVSYSQSLVTDMQIALAEAQTKPQKVEVDGLSELVAALAAQSAAIQALLSRRL